ncbi:ATP-binding protein [Catenulispora rubra]|uniref:ATP-binding protein n=1 Tax=Catenulispora rubra TaxID=280293 RepID=UPI002B272AFD|nr:ATP-binding protein [Catenulispora rubra]
MHRRPAHSPAPNCPAQPSPFIVRRTLRLAALPTAPGVARAFVAQASYVAGISQTTAETALLIVSELVTNGTRATGRVDGPPVPLPAENVAVLFVMVRAGDGTVRLDVWDRDPQRPVVQHAEDMDETGRGLLLVEALAAAWGVYTPRGAGTSGKVVWAEVAA